MKASIILVIVLNVIKKSSNNKQLHREELMVAGRKHRLKKRDERGLT
jgi:hypothetical protein